MDILQCKHTPALSGDQDQSAPPHLCLLDLPDDILLSILHRYCSRPDTARFARTEQRSLPLARSVLYTRLIIPSLSAFPALLQTLRSHADIALAVRELVVLEPMAVDPIQASSLYHGNPPTWLLPAWILAFIQSVPSAWHVDLSHVPQDILSALMRADCVVQHLLPLLSKRKMTLSLPRDSRLLSAPAPTAPDATLAVIAGSVIALERVDFAHSKCTAVVSLGTRCTSESYNGNASPNPTNGSPRHMDHPQMRVEGACWRAGRESAHGLLQPSRAGRLSQRLDDPPMLNLSCTSLQSATEASVFASTCGDIDVATSLSPRASISHLTLASVDRACIHDLAFKLPAYGGDKMASLSSLTLKSIMSPITTLVAAASAHLPHLDSLTLIDLNTPLEPALSAIDFLIRRPRSHGRALCRLKIAGIFDYLPPSESTPIQQYISPPYPLDSDISTLPSLTHLILHRKSPSATASHQSQTSRVRPRLLLSRILLPTLHTLSINELDLVVSLPTSPAPPHHLSLLHPTLRGPLAPFHLLSTATLPNLHALRIDVQNLDLDGNLLPQSAPRLRCLVAQNLTGDFSRAVAVVDLLATYPKLSHVWLDKNLWLPIAQVHKLGLALFSSARPTTKPTPPSKKQAGPRSRLARDSLPHLDRILVDNAHAQCLVGGRMGMSLELPEPPVLLVDDTCEGECGSADVQEGVGAINGAAGFADGGYLDSTQGFRPVSIGAALRCREWIEQLYHLV